MDDISNAVFIDLMERIKSDKSTVKTKWRDGKMWVDAQGNFYSYDENGEYVFYAGIKWQRFTDYKGDKRIRRM